MPRFTAAAIRSIRFAEDVGIGAYTRAELLAMGCPPGVLDARLAAHRWSRLGRAVLLHNHEPTQAQRWRAGVINCGPRAVLASFSAAQASGLDGWERDEIHVLAPAGVPQPRVVGLPVVLHRTSLPIRAAAGGTRQRLAPALLLAAAAFGSARPACGILAAGVQQRLVHTDELAAALDDSTRTRHRATLSAAIADISMGAEALSEIDFARLCRRHGLPEPTRQAVRVEPSGRRRYLDVEWPRGNRRTVVVEVDGALHLTPRRWYADQLRQNEVTLADSMVLRYPSVVVRTEEAIVVDQLRRALQT